VNENEFDFFEPGGQRTDVERTIRQILGGMTDGPIDVEPAVMKELLQNADDAGATEVSVILDERSCPPNLVSESGPLSAAPDGGQGSCCEPWRTSNEQVFRLP